MDNTYNKTKLIKLVEVYSDKLKAILTEAQAHVETMKEIEGKKRSDCLKATEALLGEFNDLHVGLTIKGLFESMGKGSYEGWRECRKRRKRLYKQIDDLKANKAESEFFDKITMEKIKMQSYIEYHGDWSRYSIDEFLSSRRIANHLSRHVRIEGIPPYRVEREIEVCESLLIQLDTISEDKVSCEFSSSIAKLFHDPDFKQEPFSIQV